VTVTSSVLHPTPAGLTTQQELEDHLESKGWTYHVSGPLHTRAQRARGIWITARTHKRRTGGRWHRHVLVTMDGGKRQHEVRFGPEFGITRAEALEAARKWIGEQS